MTANRLASIHPSSLIENGHNTYQQLHRRIYENRLLIGLYFALQQDDDRYRYQLPGAWKFLSLQFQNILKYHCLLHDRL